MKSVHYIFFALFLLVTSGASAQTNYTLEQCKELTLKNNNALKAERLSMEEASLTKKEAFTSYFPKVSAFGFGYHLKEGMIGKESAEMITMLGSSFPGMPNVRDRRNGYMLGISLEQPVFTGGQIYYGNKLAELGEETSKYQVQEAEKNILVSVEQYYWTLVALYEKRKTIQVMKNLADNLFSDVKVAVDAGVTNRNDLLQVQLKQNEIKTSGVELENSISLLKIQLAQLMNVDGGQFEIETKDQEYISNPVTLLVDHNQAVTNTNMHKLLSKNIEAKQLEKKIERGKLLPYFGVGAGYYQYNDIFKNTNPSTMVHATLSLPISDWWGGSYNLRKKQTQIDRAEYEKTDTDQKLLVMFQSYWNKLNENYNKILLAKQAIETAEENVRINKDQYQNGLSILSDLIDAQSLLQQSRDQYTEAYTGFLVARYLYLRETGR
ncbi:MAG: TolC family protein [Bacteroidota bacterium]